jgi:hypothetical protein
MAKRNRARKTIRRADVDPFSGIDYRAQTAHLPAGEN